MRRPCALVCLMLSMILRAETAPPVSVQVGVRNGGDAEVEALGQMPGSEMSGDEEGGMMEFCKKQVELAKEAGASEELLSTEANVARKQDRDQLERDRKLLVQERATLEEQKRQLQPENDAKTQEIAKLKGELQALRNADGDKQQADGALLQAKLIEQKAVLESKAVRDLEEVKQKDSEEITNLKQEQQNATENLKLQNNQLKEKVSSLKKGDTYNLD